MTGPTKLRRYLEARGITQRAFAATVEVDVTTLCRYLNGEREPGVNEALAIERATGDAVAMADWASVRAKYPAPRKARSAR